MKTKHTWIVSPNEAREARLMGLFFQEKSLNDQLNNLKGKAGDDLIDEIQEQILQVEEDLSEIEIAVEPVVNIETLTVLSVELNPDTTGSYSSNKQSIFNHLFFSI